MGKKEMENKISKKLREIWKIYNKAYPKGTYLSMFILDGDMCFYNSYFDKDKSFPVEHFEKLEDTENDL